MSLLFGLALGVILSAVFPSVPVWVRGAAGKAWGAVSGRPPARAAQSGHHLDMAPPAQSPENSTETKSTRPNLDMGKAIGNILAFFTGLIAWIVKNPAAAVCVAVLILVLVWRPFGPVIAFAKCPFGGAGILWCSQSRAELQEALKDERDNSRVLQLEARVAALSAQLAENSANDRRRVDRIITQANEGIDHAVEAVDADQLYDVYRGAYGSVWNDLAPSEPNSAPRRPPALREPSASSV